MHITVLKPKRILNVVSSASYDNLQPERATHVYNYQVKVPSHTTIDLTGRLVGQQTKLANGPEHIEKWKYMTCANTVLLVIHGDLSDRTEAPNATILFLKLHISAS
jgi:hypothetical protein